jgi:hypothetical protein
MWCQYSGLCGSAPVPVGIYRLELAWQLGPLGAPIIYRYNCLPVGMFVNDSIIHSVDGIIVPMFVIVITIVGHSSCYKIDQVLH